MNLPNEPYGVYGERLEYRVKAYTRGKCAVPGAETILYSGHTTESEAERILDALIESGLASGGHIEQHIQGIGWVVREEKDDEDPQPMHPHTQGE